MSTGTANPAVIGFPGMESFYAVRGGERSVEDDYGCHNTYDLGVNPVVPRMGDNLAHYRVSYVENTGDFYAVALGSADPGVRGRVILLGSLGVGHVEKDVHAHFADWAEGKGMGRPLSWFVDRIATYVPRPKELPEGVEKFENLGAFYEARGGEYSGESGFGKFNRNDLGVELRRVLEATEIGLVFLPAGEPDYRIAYVHDTGDFYGVENRFDTKAEVVLLGSVGPSFEEMEVYPHFADWAQRRRPWEAVQLVRGAHRVVPPRVGIQTDGSKNSPAGRRGD